MEIIRWTRGVAVLTVAMLLALPSTAPAQSVPNASGDVSLPRSAEQAELALRARRLFDAARDTSDGAKLLGVVEIMSRLTDRVDFSAEAPPPPVDMDAQTASTRRPTGNVPLVLMPKDILGLALAMAERKQDRSLIARIDAAQGRLSAQPADAAAGKCTWANCCGKQGCWTRCRWW